MAKARITTKSGVVVHVNGTPAEIVAVVRDLRRKEEEGPARKRKGMKAGRIKLVDLIGQLMQDGFFKKPRDLAGVKTALEEMGHYYPLTTLSGSMLGQVRRRNLRRLRDKKRWVYVR